MRKFTIEAWYLICKYVLILIPTRYFYQIITFVNYTRLGFKWKKLDLTNPTTFNEKLNYIKLYERNPLSVIVANKVLVREFVSERIGNEILVPQIGVFNRADEIVFSDLPKEFALKTNHGSGWNLIATDKSKLDWENEKIKLNKWLKKNAYYLSREWQYKNIVPQLLCEELLGYEIKDYKFFCFHGEPKFIQVDSERFTNHQRTIFDTDWNETEFQIRYDKIEMATPKPTTLDDMLAVSRILSKPFAFCRIDLYEHKDKVYFGEITLHPGGGMEPFISRNQEIKMGEYIDISKLNEI